MFLLRRTALKALSAPSFSQSVKSRALNSASPAINRLQRPILAFSLQRRLYSDEIVKEQEPSAAPTDAIDNAPVESSSIPVEENTATAEAISSSVYVGNLFFEVTEDQLERVFSPFGKIAHISLVCDNRGLSRGFGFIRFERPEDADAACSSLNQQVFEGRRMVVSKQTVKPSRRTIPDITTMGEPTRTLFIGNMSFEMSDKDLNDLFRDVRNVLDVRVAVDRRTGQPRGFAHADFTDAESAKQAAELLAGKSVYGRQLRVDFSRPSSQNRQV